MDQRTREGLKKAAAEAALRYLTPDAVLGVGSGSTVFFFIEALAHERPPIAAAVPSSLRTASLLRAAHLPVVDLNEVGAVDVYVDGADRVDPRLRLLKGAGGAHTREKILAVAARLFVCIVDEGKLAAELSGAGVPLEVLHVAVPAVRATLEAAGGTAVPRIGQVTDDGNAILDVSGLDLDEPERVEVELDAIPGVIECGLFARRPADLALCAGYAGVRTLSAAP